MSDFGQHGLICTLQRLQEHPGLEAEVAALTRHRPVALILPCHAVDLGQPALAGILNALSGAAFVSEVVIPVNGVDEGGFKEAQAWAAARLARPHRLLHGDALAPAGTPPGKGLNIWLALRVLARERRVAYVLCADADVSTFRLEMLARLAFALAHPQAGYTFAKAYYSRVEAPGGPLYGRVSRLFFAPLLQAVVRIGGHLPLTDFLRAFRYPLAGECGFTLELGASLPLESGWGLEVGMLCDLFRRVDPREVCQVATGGRYVHKHQPLGEGGTGLTGMAREIACTLLDHLRREGMRLDPPELEALAEAYRREAAEALRRSAALAALNALRYDDASERLATERFESALRAAFTAAPGAVLPPEGLPV